MFSSIVITAFQNWDELSVDYIISMLQVCHTSGGFALHLVVTANPSPGDTHPLFSFDDDRKRNRKGLPSENEKVRHHCPHKQVATPYRRATHALPFRHFGYDYFCPKFFLVVLQNCFAGKFSLWWSV
jgi:hypothetical protein